ncbi:MAG: phenylalanine--tRNA ligase subunit beta [Pseudomonadales bacterium]|nr:phenylalanine--tRNA ligase subunit beta [Pseudomonadales bacterium]
MKFSEAWLREWIDPGLSRDELFAQLTMAGLEIEGAEPVAGEFSGVVVGEVRSAARHPDADKLSVCAVYDGAETLQVVCGAPNVRAGMKTAFARVGARLPGDFAIKKAKLRGVESCGMLCSAAELGIGDAADGIMDLAVDLVPGTDLRAALALDDTIAEVNLTPNRGDCLSIRGLAREVGVLNDLAVKAPPIVPVVPTHAATFLVRVDDGAGCPRYLGRVIRNVDLTRPAPEWLREKLRRSGVRSIDAVVDVTNFVLLELGQPMHAFDLGALEGGIEVRPARAGERLVLLDGRDVALDTDTLVIADAGGPVAIAGVMGGTRSGVGAATVDVFLECAFFAPLAVAGTARRYGLHTEASHRYERGVDFALQRDAMERATALLLDIVGGEPGPVTEALSAGHLPVREPVRLRQSRLNALVGVEIAPEEVDAAFARLDFELVGRETQPGTGIVWTIVPPSHRFDVEREADLVEEVCRIHGYNRIPARRPVAPVPLREVPLASSGETELREQLAGLGFQEAVTFSFVDPALQDLLDPGVTALRLANPMSSEQAVMRTNLLPGLVNALRLNVSRQQERARLFEVGLAFIPGEPLRQEQRVAGLLYGSRLPESWANGREAVDFFDAKGVVERLLEWAGLRAVAFEPLADPVLHPGQSAALMVDGLRAGRLGRLHPEIEARLDFAKPVYCFELDAQAILGRGPRRYQGISRYPSVRRDLAIVVPRAVAAGAVESVVRETLGAILVDFRIFDVYQGKGIDSTEKSLGLGLTFQDASATLTDDQIGRCTQDAVGALERVLGARLR